MKHRVVTTALIFSLAWPAHSFNPKNLKILVKNSEELSPSWSARNLGWRPTRFGGSSYAWIMDGLYKDARHVFSSLFHPMKKKPGVVIPKTRGDILRTLGFQSARREGATLGVDELTVRLQAYNPRQSEPHFLSRMPTDVQTRLRQFSADAPSQHQGKVTLAHVIAEFANTKAIDGSSLTAKSIGELLDAFPYTTWKDLFADISKVVKDPLENPNNPFKQLIEHVRSLQVNPAGQRKAATDVIRTLHEYEITLNQQLATIYERIIRIQDTQEKSLEELQRHIEALEKDLQGPSANPIALAEHKGKRQALASEYMAAQNDLVLFLRIKQYDMKFTLEYLYGVIRETPGFRTAKTLDDVVTTVDTSMRSPDASEGGARDVFLRDQMPSFRWAFLRDPYFIFKGRGFGRGQFVFGDFLRRFARRDFHDLFPCIRKGMVLYHCRLSSTTTQAIQDSFLDVFVKKVAEGTPEQRQTYKFYADVRNELITKARKNSSVHNPDILQGLFALMTQMNPYSRSGRQLRNALATSVDDAQLETVALDLGRHRFLMFSPTGMPIYGIPSSGNKLLSLGSSALPLVATVRLGRFTKRVAKRQWGGWVSNALADQDLMFRRNRQMIETNVPAGEARDRMLAGTARAQQRSTAIIQASSELGLTRGQAQQMVNSFFAPRSREVFLKHVSGFADPYRRIAGNRQRLLRQLDQLETTYARRLSELDENLRLSLLRSAGPIRQDLLIHETQQLVADAFAVRERIKELETQLGITKPAEVTTADTRGVNQAELEKTIGEYQTLKTEYDEKLLEQQELLTARPSDVLDDINVRKKELGKEMSWLETEMGKVKQRLDSQLTEPREFTNRNQHLEAQLIKVEEAKRALSKLIDQKASADLIAAARKNLDTAETDFKTKFPDYNLEARLQRSTLARDLPGRRGSRWNQLTYETFRRSGADKHALQEGGEALEIAQKLARYGLHTGDETWKTLVRQCVANRGNGRALLRSGPIVSGSNWRPWTQDFWRQWLRVSDQFSGVHNEARLDALQHATLPWLKE